MRKTGWGAGLALGMLALALWPARGVAQEAVPVILPMRERAAVVDRWLERRLDTVVPALMRREGVAMWILIAREYNEDPVLRTMLPATWLSARRRTILVFFDRGPAAGVERLAVARYDVGRLFTGAWDPAAEPDPWRRLAALIAERDPATIALNRSAHLRPGRRPHGHRVRGVPAMPCPPASTTASSAASGWPSGGWRRASPRRGPSTR
ncbi:MAG: hypothetical protein KatS3mg042_0768 [Rhodothermaceae bacterium]|nr:MAG: hypothetical protein KatS3mg042_0768 [Rhodothermaceae bacterium]